MATYIFVSKGEVNGKKQSGAFLFCRVYFKLTIRPDDNKKWRGRHLCLGSKTNSSLIRSNVVYKSMGTVAEHYLAVQRN